MPAAAPSSSSTRVEAEPASFKDRTLLELAPHLVLDGAVLAAEALRADEAIVAVGEHAGGVGRERLRGDRGTRRAPTSTAASA